jgi:hypothetical protein
VQAAEVRIKQYEYSLVKKRFIKLRIFMKWRMLMEAERKRDGG